MDRILPSQRPAESDSDQWRTIIDLPDVRVRLCDRAVWVESPDGSIPREKLLLLAENVAAAMLQAAEEIRSRRAPGGAR